MRPTDDIAAVALMWATYWQRLGTRKSLTADELRDRLRIDAAIMRTQIKRVGGDASDAVTATDYR